MLRPPGASFHLWSGAADPSGAVAATLGLVGPERGRGSVARRGQGGPCQQVAEALGTDGLPAPRPPRAPRPGRGGLGKRAAAGGGGEGEPAPAPAPARGGARSSLGRGPRPSTPPRRDPRPSGGTLLPAPFPSFRTPTLLRACAQSASTGAPLGLGDGRPVPGSQSPGSRDEPTDLCARRLFSQSGLQERVFSWLPVFVTISNFPDSGLEPCFLSWSAPVSTRAHSQGERVRLCLRVACLLRRLLSLRLLPRCKYVASTVVNGQCRSEPRKRCNSMKRVREMTRSVCALGTDSVGTALSRAACVCAGGPEPIPAQLPPGIWPPVGIVPRIPDLPGGVDRAGEGAG